MSPPNILYLHSHDTGRYVSPYGYAVDTPNIQRLAEEGIVFRNAFSAAPTCSPSRAGLVSGSCPHSCGILGLAHRGFLIQPEKHIVHQLNKQGYTCHLRGIQHVYNDAFALGYETVVKHTQNAAVGSGSPSALAEAFLSSQPKEPFFLSVGFFDTHRKYPELDPQDDTRYVRPPAHIPDLPETREDWVTYCKSVKRLDEGFGIVLRALEENGFADNTLVICTTDHGLAWPRMKCNLTDPGIGIMLIIRGPGGFGGGKVCESLVSQIDLFPTICDLLEIEKPDWLEGNSLMPIVRGESAEVDDEIFGEVTYHASYEPQRCVRTKRYKYIRRFGDRRELVRPNIDASLTKTAMLDFGFGTFEQEPEQLYDVMLDPVEFRNLVNDPKHQDALKDMRKRLDDWMQRTNDPLLKGPVPIPEGAWATDPDELDPRGRRVGEKKE
jgi:N-sulfoglucosamine sulfohydrolase